MFFFACIIVLNNHRVFCWPLVVNLLVVTQSQLSYNFCCRRVCGQPLTVSHGFWPALWHTINDMIHDMDTIDLSMTMLWPTILRWYYSGS